MPKDREKEAPKHALMLKGSAYNRDDAKTQKKARKQTSTDDRTLDKKRLDYQHEGNELSDIIQAMVNEQARALALQKKIAETKLAAPSETTPAALQKLEAQRQEAEQNYQGMFNLAALKGYLILHQGLSLITDMLSVEQYEKNRKTGETEYWRSSVADIMWEVGAGVSTVSRRVRRGNEMLDAAGVAAGWWHKGQHIRYDAAGTVDEDEVDEDAGESTETPVAAEPLGVGVPQEDIQKAKLSREKIIQMVREPEKAQDAPGDPKPQ
jgi:hypothetical protein